MRERLSPQTLLTAINRHRKTALSLASIIIIFSFLFVNIIYAQENIVNYDEGSAPVLNNELRKLRKNIENTHGVPSGGTTDQVLTKSSSTDYDTEWQDVSSLISTADFQIFTSNGNFTAPTGITTVFLSGCGGGGGGGASAGEGAATAGGGGGASGQAIINYPYTVVPGNTYAVVIGTGGAGGTGVNLSPGNAGSNGTNTTFNAAVTILGGKGGSGGTNATPGAGGQENYGASSSGLPSVGQVGSNANPGAYGAGGCFGYGGTGGTNGAGSNGGLYGGGGGGARLSQGGGGGTGASGGNGADGILIVSWY